MVQEQDLDPIEFTKQLQDVYTTMMSVPKITKKLKMTSLFAAFILPSLDKANKEILAHHIGISVEVDDEIDGYYKFIY